MKFFNDNYMKRATIFFFCLAMMSHFSYAQKNPFEKTLNTKKLGVIVKKVKDKDKDDYYQQYYRLSLVEDLAQYPNLKEIKPAVLYQFVKEITPPIATKKLSKEHRAMRKEAQLSLDQYLSKKDWTNPVKSLNLLTYVDPENLQYHTKVDPEGVTILLPKKVFAFGTINTKENERKLNYLWMDDKNNYHVVNIFPEENKINEDFFADIRSVIPDYVFPEDMAPTQVRRGDKKVKSDAEFYYIRPFEIGNSNIEYKTLDFKKFILARYKVDGGPWTDFEHRPRKW